MVVIQSESEGGLPPLKLTIEESRHIAAAVPGFMFNVDGKRRDSDLEPENPEVATIQNVLDRLNEVSILHLACHGKPESMNSTSCRI